MAILQGGSYTASVYSENDLTAASAITLQVTAPDNSTQTYSTAAGTVTATAPSGNTLSVASAVIPATLVGDYLLVWDVAGTYPDVTQDQFSVEAASLNLISISDLRDELNIAPDDPVSTPQLQRWLRAARGVVENVTGPVSLTPRVETFDGGGPTVVLSSQYVASVTTVTEAWDTTSIVLPAIPFGTASTGPGYVWDPVTNVIRRRDGSTTSPSYFAGGRDAVQVAYVAGMTPIPQDIQQAAARMIEHWWRKSKNPYRASGAFTGQPGDDAGMTMVGNYEIPNGAMALLEPWRRYPGIA